MRGTYITALVIAVILALWLYSGDHEQELIDGSIAIIVEVVAGFKAREFVGLAGD